VHERVLFVILQVLASSVSLAGQQEDVAADLSVNGQAPTDLCSWRQLESEVVMSRRLEVTRRMQGIVQRVHQATEHPPSSSSSAQTSWMDKVLVKRLMEQIEKDPSSIDLDKTTRPVPVKPAPPHAPALPSQPAATTGTQLQQPVSLAPTPPAAAALIPAIASSSHIPLTSQANEAAVPPSSTAQPPLQPSAPLTVNAAPALGLGALGGGLGDAKEDDDEELEELDD
jgi:hypothetical protein